MNADRRQVMRRSPSTGWPASYQWNATPSNAPLIFTAGLGHTRLSDPAQFFTDETPKDALKAVMLDVTFQSFVY